MKSRKAFLVTFTCLILIVHSAMVSCTLLPSASSGSELNEPKEEDPTSNIVSTTANVVTDKEATLRFKNNAKNIRIQVQKGTIVEAGDILVESDSFQQTLAVDEAQAQLANAKAFYDALIREGVREVRQSEKDAALEQIEAAEAALDLAEENLTATSIIAPFNGSIIDIYVDPYTNVFAGEPVLLIADTQNLKIETDDLDEKDAAKVHVGDAVNIFFDAIPDKTYNGIVMEIAQKTTSGAGNDFAVTISTFEPIQKLRWGMSAYVEIKLGSATEEGVPDVSKPDSESINENKAAGAPKERRICEIMDFLSETIPDGSVFAPGEAFTKSWTFRNAGTCTWDTNYKLVFIDGAQMEAQTSIPFPEYVAPGDLMTIEVDLIAPEEEGKYRGNWQLQNDEGGKIYLVWVDITVGQKE